MREGEAAAAVVVKPSMFSVSLMLTSLSGTGYIIGIGYGDKQMTTEAHFTNGSKARPAVLALARVNEAGRREWLSRQPVAGRAEARKLAHAAGATPWNF